MTKTTAMALRREITPEEILQEKQSDGSVERAIWQDSIRLHFRKINDSDAILVLNYTKKGIENYIGGNIFLKIGFAHVLNKKYSFVTSFPTFYIIKQKSRRSDQQSSIVT